MGGRGSGRRKAEAIAGAVASAARAGAAAALEHAENGNEEEDEDPEDGDGVSLFPGLAGRSLSVLDTILVQRLGPVAEGTLGDLQRSDGIDEIEKRWGGGKYKLIGRDTRKQNLSGAFRTVEIAGEPKFRSRAAESEYRRQVGEPLETRGSGTPGSLDIIAILTKQQEGARIEHERREAEREAQHKREIDRLKIEADQRREERKADDERREKENREREERDAKRAEESRRHEREFYTNMLTMKGGAGESPIASLMQGINLALKLKETSGGDAGPADPLSGLIAGLPDLLALLKTGNAPALAAPATVTAPAAPTAPARPAAASPAPKGAPAGGGRGVKFEGEIGDKAMAAIKHLKAIGQDPEKVLTELLERVAMIEAPPASPANGKAEASTQSVVEPENVTKPVESATAQG